LAKDYQTRDTFGYLVFVSESGKQYDNLWVNISGLNKTFLASTAEIVDGEVKGENNLRFSPKSVIETMKRI
jgi:hypothetical protein